MSNLSPSLEDWRKLFNLILEFKSIKSWEWMEDTTIFGVQSPKTKEICYCVVLGKERDFYGLGIYIGDKGLTSLLEMLDMRYTEEEQFYRNDLIMINFTDREYLSRSELNLIKKLGLKFRGPNNWVSIRRYIPGFFPCSINKEEAELLLSILGEITNVCLRFKEDPKLMASDRHLIRMVKGEGKDISWEDSWVELDYPEEMISSYDPKVIFNDVIDISKLKKTANEWFIDLFFLPVLISEEEDRSNCYFYIGFVLNVKTGALIGLKAFKYEREHRYTYPQELFLDAITSTKSLPNAILVRDLDVYDALAGFVSKVKVGLKMAEDTESLDEIRRFVIESMTKE